MPINVEIKARCRDPGRIRDILNALHARFVGTDHQTDTYFDVPNGRLKLREGTIENALIYYEREDCSGPKHSDVAPFKTQPHSSLKEVLSSSIDIKIVVSKRREIYFRDNVKFHIDSVDGLGAFIEIEAIDETGTLGEAKLLEQCRYYLDLFKIDENDLVSTSYSDLLMCTERERP